MKWTKSTLESLVLKTDPSMKRGDLDVDCALVCLAPACVDGIGQDYKKIARWLGLDRDKVRVWVQRLKENRLWIDGKFYYQDLQKSDLALWLYVLVAQGEIVAVNNGELSTETSSQYEKVGTPQAIA